MILIILIKKEGFPSGILLLFLLKRRISLGDPLIILIIRIQKKDFPKESSYYSYYSYSKEGFP